MCVELARRKYRSPKSQSHLQNLGFHFSSTCFWEHFMKNQQTVVFRVNRQRKRWFTAPATEQFGQQPVSGLARVPFLLLEIFCLTKKVLKNPFVTWKQNNCPVGGTPSKQTVLFKIRIFLFFQHNKQWTSPIQLSWELPKGFKMWFSLFFMCLSSVWTT